MSPNTTLRPEGADVAATPSRLVVVAIVGNPTRTNDTLVRAWRARGIDAIVLTPARAVDVLETGDVALIRLDVLPSLDGVEPGLREVGMLLRRRVRVLNRPRALLAMHDKLRTARVLAKAGLPHPRTVGVDASTVLDSLPVPGVLKPRFGSWGKDVVRYESRDELVVAVTEAMRAEWWAGAGAVAQELVQAPPRDLRLVVAGGHVVGAGSRIARPGEWRTNVSLGADLVTVEPPEEAARLGCAAVAAVGAELAGVDLLHGPDGWVVLELNGAVDFDLRYQRPGDDLFTDVATALELPLAEIPPEREETDMTKTMQGEPARVGDVIEITGHAVGDAPRLAEIVELLGEPDHEHFRVRWEDGHESIFFPGNDARIVRPAKAAARKAKK